MAEMSDEEFNIIFLGTDDPEHTLDGRPVPAATTLLYGLCERNEVKFEEATRLVRLFVERACDHAR